MFNPAPLAPFFRFNDYLIAAGGVGGAVIVLAANPMRLTVSFSVTSGSCIIGPSSKITSSSGINVLPGNSPLTFNYTDWAAVVGGAWYLNTPSTSALYIVELIAVVP